MKIKLTSAANRELTDARASLAQKLATHSKFVERLGQLQAREDSLVAEIEKLRKKLDVLDSAAVRTISELQGQRDLISGEILQVEKNSPANDLEFQYAAESCARNLSGALILIFEQKIEEIIEAIFPFFESRERARRAAGSTDLAICFQRRLNLLGNRPSIPACEQILKFTDETLAGNGSWIWSGSK